jgi:hypothetical protein
LCASLTMRREIVATRRAGLTTAVIKRIPSKGKHAHDHDSRAVLIISNNF